jgi:hypothetical protein
MIEKGGVMKKLALAVLMLAAPAMSGCATPALTAQERYAQINRNWGWEYDQIADDTDHLLLLRPAGRMSIWDVYHRD